MEINATLLFQIGHFACAYVIVRYILVRPAIKLVQVDVRAHDQLEQQVREQEQRVMDRARHNDQEWEMLTRKLRDARPELHRELDNPHHSDIQAPPVPCERCESVPVVETIADFVVDRVRHDA